MISDIAWLGYVFSALLYYITSTVSRKLVAGGGVVTYGGLRVMMSISSRGVFCWSCRLVWANSWVGGCVWSADTVTSVGHLTVNTFWEHDIIGLVLGDGLLHTKIPLSIYYVIHYHSSIEPSLRPPKIQTSDPQTMNDDLQRMITHVHSHHSYPMFLPTNSNFKLYCHLFIVLSTHITVVKRDGRR